MAAISDYAVGDRVRIIPRGSVVGEVIRISPRLRAGPILVRCPDGSERGFGPDELELVARKVGVVMGMPVYRDSRLADGAWYIEFGIGGVLWEY